jgi:hypothetical protein
VFSGGMTLVHWRNPSGPCFSSFRVRGRADSTMTMKSGVAPYSIVRLGVTLKRMKQTFILILDPLHDLRPLSSVSDTQLWYTKHGVEQRRRGLDVALCCHRGIGGETGRTRSSGSSLILRP